MYWIKQDSIAWYGNKFISFVSTHMTRNISYVDTRAAILSNKNWGINYHGNMHLIFQFTCAGTQHERRNARVLSCAKDLQ